MAHVFSSGQDPRQQLLTPEEVEALIHDHERAKSMNDGHVSVEDMAETLGVPASQVQQRILELRSQRSSGEQPMSNSSWLKNRLWVWILVSVVALSMSGAGIGALKNLPKLGDLGGLPEFNRPRPNYKDTDGIYRHEKIVAGRNLGLESIPGFSYELILPPVDAAVNGDSKQYVPVDELSEESLGVVQEQLTQKILASLDKTVKQSPPEWINNEAVAIVKPNYYPGGDPIAIDLKLSRDQFPYRPESPSGKALHDKVLSEIRDNWTAIIDN